MVSERHTETEIEIETESDRVRNTLRCREKSVIVFSYKI